MPVGARPAPASFGPREGAEVADGPPENRGQTRQPEEDAEGKDPTQDCPAPCEVGKLPREQASAQILRRDLPVGWDLPGLFPGIGGREGLDPGRHGDDDQADEEEDECHRTDPTRKGQGVLQDIHHLHDAPGYAQVNQKNLNDAGLFQTGPEVWFWHNSGFLGR